MNKTPEETLCRGRIARAKKGFQGRTAHCETCGDPCPPAKADRFGVRPPTGCSSTCVERALQARAKAAAMSATCA